MQNETKEIDLLQVFYLLSKHRKRLFLLALVGALIGALLTGVDYMKRRHAPLHVLTCSFAVVAKNSSGNYGSNTDSPGYNDVKLAEDITESVIFVIKSDRVITAAVERSHLLGVNKEEIQENLTIKQHEETQIVTLELRWVNANEGLSIVEAISEVVPDILIETLDLGSVSVIDYPRDSGVENTIIRWQFILYGAFLFFGIYAMFLILGWLIFPTLTNLSTFEKDFEGLECLGIIPDDERYFSSKPFALDGQINPEHVQVQEALIATAHMLMYMSEHEKHRCYYITSSEAGEGKTGIAANLAIELSHREKRVLVVDMDVRRPSLGACFIQHVEHDHSLNAVFEGDVTAQEAVIKLNDNLSILPARLEQERVRIDSILHNRIKSLFDSYDIILLDAPPVGMVSDTMLLNALVDQVILVIKYDYARIETIKACIMKLKKSGMTVCGAIITNVNNHFGNGNNYAYRRYDAYYSHHSKSEKARSKKAEKTGGLRRFWKKKKDKNEEAE